MTSVTAPAAAAGLGLAAQGVLLLLFRGLLQTVQLSLGRTLKELEWPYFRLMSGVCLLASVPIGLLLLARGTPLPERGHRKWVVLRGLCGAGSFVCSVLAVQVGASVGDVEALRSVNMAASALLGRALLGEAVGAPAAAALGCSAAGAILISQPECIFGARLGGGKGDAVLGHALALASGLCTAGVFIASRKAPGTSAWVQALSAHVMSSVAAALLPACGAVQDFSLEPLAAAPVQALGLFVLLFGNTFVSTVTLSAAAQWCTAAESAIVSTSAGMGFGFAAQMELFGAAPDRLSLCGAALMFCGVLVMAVAQSEQKAAEESKEPKETASEEDADVELGPLARLPLLDAAGKLSAADALLPAASDVSTCDYGLDEFEDEGEDACEDVAV